MEQTLINHLKLETAFACMICDGEVDKRELETIRSLNDSENQFGEIDVSSELNNLLAKFRTEGNNFFVEYLTKLATSNLNEEDELQIIDIAIKTIEADNKIEYSEIKFFKLLRRKLRVNDNVVLERYPTKREYLESDIMTESYIAKFEGDTSDIKSLIGSIHIQSLENISKLKIETIGDENRQNKDEEI